MNKATIIGGLDFIGYSICTRLLEEGFTVYALDLEPKEGSLEEEKLLRIGRNANFHFSERDSTLSSLKTYPACDLLFYIGVAPFAEVRNRSVYDRYVDHMKTSLKEVCDYCNKHQTKLILLSTLNVFNEKQEEINEDVTPEPSTLLGTLHYQQEEQLREISNASKLNYTILRLPTVYGPWQPSHMVYHRFMMGGPIDSSDEQLDEESKDLVYVDDAVEAIVNVSFLEDSEQVLHLTSGKKGEWQRGVELLNEEFGKNFSRSSYSISNTKLTKLIPSLSSTSLVEGLAKQKKYIEWFKQWKCHE
ncbi:NAD(P)-dependent oxidoreductase [Bacillus timonensis]|nr:NAD(P)-dependent oxidoreductase [Bacillus timonensis]